MYVRATSLEHHESSGAVATAVQNRLGPRNAGCATSTQPHRQAYPPPQLTPNLRSHICELRHDGYNLSTVGSQQARDCLSAGCDILGCLSEGCDILGPLLVSGVLRMDSWLTLAVQSGASRFESSRSLSCGSFDLLSAADFNLFIDFLAEGRVSRSDEVRVNESERERDIASMTNSASAAWTHWKMRTPTTMRTTATVRTNSRMTKLSTDSNPRMRWIKRSSSSASWSSS
mmetsp:Transcript_67342/g.184683  ORF Transcript_67342/g.184683 Transcript_67342/m.184683 type:complete len:230 (+) Transcript_67342:225-914(+)